MCVIRISAKGEYIVLENDRDFIAKCKSLEDAMCAAKGCQVIFGWL